MKWNVVHAKKLNTHLKSTDIKSAVSSEKQLDFSTDFFFMYVYLLLRKQLSPNVHKQ